MEAMEIRYSVIIPCYNAADTIERALDSLIKQAFLDWEVICIDDCSTDNTREVIRAYAEKHKESSITLLCNRINSGPGVSRNNGIAIANGDYLMFLDADDYYNLSTFDVLNNKFAQTDADIVFFGCNQIIGNTVRKRPAASQNSLMDYMALVGGSLCAGVWRRSLWADVEIPAISNAEDIAVIPVLISRATKVVTIPDCLYNYVHSNISTSSRHTPQVSYNFISSFHYTLQHIDIDQYRNEVEFHGIKTVIYGSTLNAIKSGMNKNEILELWSEFEQKFPKWKKNRYLSRYAKSKRIFVWLASRRLFMALKLYTKLHSFVLNAIG